MKKLHHTVCAIFVLPIAACGGGGGSAGGGVSTPPPVPPPPIINTPPTIQYSLSKSVVFENEIFSIDVNDSTDADGGIDTYSITQLSGSMATPLGNINLGLFRWRAPTYEFDTIEDITFEIVLTDVDGDSSSEIVRVSVRGFAGPGTPVAIFDPPLNLFVGTGSSIGGDNSPENVIVTSAVDPNNPMSSGSAISFIGGPSGSLDYSDDAYLPIEGTFESVEFIDYDSLGFNLLAVFAEEFSVLSETEDTLRWFRAERSMGGLSFTFMEADRLSVENPCFVAGRTDTSQDYVWIGQRNKGLSVVRLEALRDSGGVAIGFDDTVLQQLDNGRSFCHIFPTILPSSIPPGQFNDGGGQGDFPTLLAIDYNTNELVFLDDIDEDERYNEVAVIPLDTQTTENLAIVDVISQGSPNLVPRYIAILMTDGNHSGTHRLVVVYQDNTDPVTSSNGEIRQEIFSWDEGVPVSLMQGNFGGTRPENQFVEDLVVITSTSTQSLFFDNITDPNVGVAEPPVFAQPTFFDVGIGAASAVRVAHRDGSALEEILVSFPETGELRLFSEREP